jgi:hypothetical protein
VAYSYQTRFDFEEPTRADVISFRQLFRLFPWAILAGLSAVYEAARERYYRDNRKMANDGGRCPKKRRSFKEKVAGLFRDVFLGGEDPAGVLCEDDDEEPDNPTGAGAKGIPFLPQLKAWLVAPFCGFAANGRAVARMLRLRPDVFEMCDFPGGLPPDERQMRRFNEIMYRYGVWNEVKRALVSSNIEAQVIEHDGTLAIDTTFAEDFATLGKTCSACTTCASACSEPEKTCEVVGVVVKSNSNRRPGVKASALVTPTSELPLDAVILNGALHESQTLEPTLRPFIENFPGLAESTVRIVADALIANGPNRAYLAEAIPGAELIGTVNPRNAKATPSPARGIAQIDKYGVPHCIGGHKLFLLGRDGTREQYIWACPVHHPQRPEADLTCPCKADCSSSPMGRIFRVDRARTPQVRWEAPEHSKRNKKYYALRTAIERWWSRGKVVLPFGRVWARGRLALQAHADRMVIAAHFFARAAWEAGKMLLMRSYTALAH